MTEEAPAPTVDNALKALQAALAAAKLGKLDDEEAAELAKALDDSGWLYLGKVPKKIPTP